MTKIGAIDLREQAILLGTLRPYGSMCPLDSHVQRSISLGTIADIVLTALRSDRQLTRFRPFLYGDRR